MKIKSKEQKTIDKMPSTSLSSQAWLASVGRTKRENTVYNKYYTL